MMSKRKSNKADLAPSRTEKKGFSQYVLGFFLLLYTLFCGLPVILAFIAALQMRRQSPKTVFFCRTWSWQVIQY